MLLCLRIRCIPYLAFSSKAQGIRKYSICCPPRPLPCGGPGQGAGRRVVPPAECRPGPIPPNPCVPRFHNGNYKKYKYLALFVMFPIILIQMFRTLCDEPPHKDVCRDYEYMRLRSKKYPWRDGVETFFHNPHVNHLPGDCEPPPLECDD